MLKKYFIVILMTMSLSAVAQTRCIPIDHVRLLDSRWRDNTTKLTITGKVKDEIMIRYPSWAKSVTMKVNGKKVSAKPKNGYITLRSSLFTLNSNEVEMLFPMKDYEVEAHGDLSRVALMHGPVVMAGELGTEGMQSPAPFSDSMQYNDYYTYDYHVPENMNKVCMDRAGKDIRLTPLFDIHRQRYVVYWNK